MENKKEHGVSVLLDKLSALLQGEPLRAITYGAAVIVYFAAKILGVIPDQSFDQAVIEAAAGLAILVTVIETARRFVTPAAKLSANGNG